jgi:DnaJ domain
MSGMICRPGASKRSARHLTSSPRHRHSTASTPNNLDQSMSSKETPPSPPLPTYLQPPTKTTCPSCSAELYYYPPTRINNVKAPVKLSCAACKHNFPPSPAPSPPTEAFSNLSIKTHYEVLGIDRTATPDGISRAYRKKSLKCHPDRTSGREKEWEQLTKAYEILGDKRKRHWYDMELEKGITDPDPEGDTASQGISPWTVFNL